MLHHATPSLSAASLDQPDHNVAPDFAWAVLGGLVVLGMCALLYAVIVYWGGMRPDLALSAGGAAPLSAFPRELASFVLSGTLVALIARSLSARQR